MTTYALGTTVTLTIEARNASDQLVTPSSISVVIQLPDGTSVGPFTAPDVVADGTGLYHYDYPTTVAGRHIARWSTTSPTVVDEEPFEVAGLWREAGIVSLTAAKAQLNIDLDYHGDDDEITRFILGMTGPIEAIVGACVQRTHTEKSAPGHAVALNHTPVMSLVSVAAIRTGAVAPLLADLDVDGPTGIVERLDGGRIPGPLRWVYVAGRSEIQGHVILAALLILQHMWETQRGSQGVVGRGGSDDVWDPRFGFSIPRRAHELLGDQPPGVA